MIFLKKPTDTFQCAIYSVKIFAEKKKWHMHCSYERDTVSSPSFHYMQLVNASTPKALLFSLLPSPPLTPGHPPGIWTFMDWFIQIPGPPPQPQDHRCIEMRYSMAAFISQTLLLKNQMF